MLLPQINLLWVIPGDFLCKCFLVNQSTPAFTTVLDIRLTNKENLSQNRRSRSQKDQFAPTYYRPTFHIMCSDPDHYSHLSTNRYGAPSTELSQIKRFVEEKVPSVCDYECEGNKAESCGGSRSFDLYSIVIPK